MRLTRLELEAYGAFSGLALAFRPDARLHVVYGPNEAGKSTALAAVSDLLFGFELKTDYAFLHDMKNLRVAGEILGRDGARFAFRRRKGRSETLLDLSGAALKDDALAPFLGGLSRELFARAFGLNADALRDGADALLSADGETGASLFAAASGMRGLDEVRKGLEADADAIFAPRASKDRRFYQAQARYDAARKAAKERELRSGDWQALNAAVAERETAYEALALRRRACVEDLARLQRLLRAAPILREIDSFEDGAAEFADLPDLAAPVVAEIGARIDAAAAAREASRRAGLAHEAAEADAKAAAVDGPALDRAAEIERLHAASGADAKARADLPGVEREAAAYAADLARLAAQLGLADAEAVERALPTAAACAELRELIEEGRALADDDRARAKRLADERETLAGLESGRRGAEPPIDPRLLRETLAGLQGQLRILARRDEISAAREAEAKALSDAAVRLSPTVVDLDALAAASLPAPAVVERAAKALERAGEDVERAAVALREAQGDVAALDAELLRLDAGPPIASPEALAAARDARDAQWLALRRHVLGSDTLAGDQLVGRVADHERATAAADRVADGQAADAGRVARRQELDRRRAEAARRADDSHEGERSARQNFGAAQADWSELWSASRLSHARPEAAAGWLAAVTALLARREKTVAAAAEIARLDALDARLKPEVLSIAEASGLAAPSGASAVEIAERVEARLRALTDAWTAAAQVEGQIADVRRRIERLERAGESAASTRKIWETRWGASLAAVGLDAGISLAAATAALAGWDKAPDLIRERASRVRRVEGIRRDVEAFRSEAAVLVAELAPHLADIAPDGAVRRLNERLSRAREAEARRAEAARRRDDAAARLGEATRAEGAAAGALRRATEGLPEGVDPVAALERLKRRDVMRGDLSNRRRDLAAQSDGFSEAELRADLDGFSPDAARGQLAELTDEERHLEDAARQSFADLSEARRQREAREQGVGAEAAAAEQRSAEAELAASAREWTVLKLAGLLISEAIARHRAERRDPLVGRAGALFGAMTGGAFSGIEEDYDENDVRRLVGRRQSGEMTAIGGLSEGTRDQFYLALRLSFLEDHAARAEAAPFIGDDLFSSFDDSRTAHGLSALAEVGATVQPILFTHHRSVVEIARSTLGDAVDVIEITR